MSNVKWQLKALQALRRQLPGLSAPVRPSPEALPGRRDVQLKEIEARDVIAAYQAGATVYDLQHRFDIACQTISKILKRHGVQLRRTSRRPPASTGKAGPWPASATGWSSAPRPSDSGSSNTACNCGLALDGDREVLYTPRASHL